MPTARHIYSVTELNTEARNALESSFGLAWLEAEISNISRPASGHWYFTLKDKKSQIRCAFFKGRNRLLNFRPEDGQLVLVRGRVSLYEARGDYQLIIDHMEPAGEGDLQRAYEEIKQRLHAEGLFDEVHKQLPPSIPKTLGIITSPSGAAVRDALNVLERRWPAASIIIYPTSVQGEPATAQIIQALDLAEKRNECDVLLLVRGGGSLEDLWPFNNEVLAKAIFDCSIPIISGIGHEVDFTIADFVADLRAPTPSAAAELVTPDQQEIIKQLQQHKTKIRKLIEDNLRNHSQQLDWYSKHLQQFHPGKQLLNQRKRLQTLSSQLQQAINTKLTHEKLLVAQLYKRTHSFSPARELQQLRNKVTDSLKRLNNEIKSKIELSRYRLNSQAHALNTISPIATLSRGYSISYLINTNTPVTQATQLNIGDKIKTRFEKGHTISKIESIDE